MTISLAILADRLQRAVPPRNDAPGDYEQLCRDAVEQLSQDVPVITTATIQVVAGQATYALPADFLSIIELTGAAGGNGIIIGDNGLIPIGNGWQENCYVEGDTLRLDPTPGYTATRTLRYAARYVATNGVYGRLSENGARVALLYGQYLALMAQATATAGDGWSYKIGDESVDKRGLGAAIQAQAAAALSHYNNAVRPLQGYGSRYKANPFAQVEV
jgi:hypothetical protein